jgi:hypothetical protein
MCVKGARIGQRRQAEPETQEADSLRAKAQPFRESYRLGINEMGQHQGVNVTENHQENRIHGDSSKSPFHRLITFSAAHARNQI